MRVKDGKDVTFSYSHNEGSPKVLNNEPIDGSYLPPWDRALRIGVAAKGNASQKAVFEEFEVMHDKK